MQKTDYLSLYHDCNSQLLGYKELKEIDKIELLGTKVMCCLELKRYRETLQILEELLIKTTGDYTSRYELARECLDNLSLSETRLYLAYQREHGYIRWGADSYTFRSALSSDRVFCYTFKN